MFVLSVPEPLKVGRESPDGIKELFNLIAPLVIKAIGTVFRWNGCFLKCKFTDFSYLGS